MLAPIFIFLIFLGLRLALAAAANHLSLTAVVSDDDGIAKFECWEMAVPFSTYPTVGDAIPGLAEVANVSYVVLPPRSKEGIHKPPHLMSVSHSTNAC